MSTLNLITGITLAGFQVFDEPTYIPLDRLTLLFGPNSAGKSSIQDAIEVVSILQSADYLFDGWGGDLNLNEIEIIERHRRNSPNNRQGEPGGHQTLEESNNKPSTHIYIRRSTCMRLDEVISIASEKDCFAKEFECPIEIEDRWIIGDGDCDYSYEQMINGECAVRVNDNLFEINLGHAVFKSSSCSIDFYDFSIRFEKYFTYKNGYLRTHCISGFSLSGTGFNARNKDWLKITNNSIEDGLLSSGALKNVMEYLSLLVGNLMNFTHGNFGINWVNVAASRKIPTPLDLTFQFSSSGASDFSSPPVSNNNQYKSLAKSLGLDYFKSNKIETMFKFNYGDVKNPLVYLSRSVNRALGEHLFLEKGYRVGFKYRVLLSADQSSNLVENQFLEIDSNPDWVIQLNLYDAENRELRFEDVGSGIGYVLPVLCAVYDRKYPVIYDSYTYDIIKKSILNDESKNSDSLEEIHDRYALSVCFIQQPELHLHPALQAAIGDVFIEGSESGNQLLVETHSEYLLLRILRRIRQTHQESVISPELKLNSQDVCVLYFQPVAGGVTKVRRLRISEGGEFMDRWPDGFFPERDRELLDE